MSQEADAPRLPVGDLELLCPQCGQDFTLSEAERRRIWQEKLTQPKRCADCRNENKKEGAG